MFDADPPFVAGAFQNNYDQSLATIKGRFWYVQLKKRSNRAGTQLTWIFKSGRCGCAAISTSKEPLDPTQNKLVKQKITKRTKAVFRFKPHSPEI